MADEKAGQMADLLVDQKVGRKDVLKAEQWVGNWVGQTVG